MGLPADYHPSLDDPDAWVPYRYIPSKAAAIIFVALFSLTTILHIFQLIRKRTWYFIPLIVGGLFESVGYIGRLISSNNLWALGPFIMQSLLILVAPALFAASIYIILGRIILLVDGEEYSLIRTRWLTKVFVAGDVLSFLTQSGGGGIQAMQTVSSMKTGQNIIIAGLFMQVTFFALFIMVAGVFHYRLVRNGVGKQSAATSTRRSRFREGSRRLTGSSTAPISQPGSSAVEDLPWKRHLYALYAASILIMIRSVFRVIEYLMGNDGYLLRHEVFLYVFDATLMFLVMVLFNWIHPSEITDLYQRRKSEAAEFEMQHTREQYMGQE